MVHILLSLLVAASLALMSSAPAAPTDLVAIAVSPTEIDLAWTDNSANENGFGVLRCQGSSDCFDFGEIATLPPDTMSFQDTGRTPGITYRYLVRAFNLDGVQYSNVAEATTPQILPAAPSGLTATDGKHGFRSWVDLGWTDNANNEAAFVIERCRGANCTDYSAVATVGANVTTYRDTTVARRSTYSYRVHATNSAGDSGHSNTASVLIR